ncbi:unnamed protein product [Ilex paraguariensis]|uniref:Uncharacterized protein n=1 Tax=Ilex paraguariensis TaxID=185542 RepID=A0ABC8TJ19_9AQUA
MVFMLMQNLFRFGHGPNPVVIPAAVTTVIPIVPPLAINEDASLMGFTKDTTTLSRKRMRFQVFLNSSLRALV